MRFKSIRASHGGRAAITPFHVLKHHRFHHNPRIAIFSDVNKHNRPSKRSTRPNSASPSSSSSSAAAVQKSSSHSIKTHLDVIKNPPVCKKNPSRSNCSQTPPLSLENTVGILGGFSVFSTLIFLEKLVWLSTRDGSDQGSVPFVVFSDPSLYTQQSIRTQETTISSSNSERAHWNHLPVAENLRKKVVFLEESGAGCIVIPCHLSHTWFKEISGRCSLPVLHIGECVAKELKQAKLKPIEAGSNLRIGVIATDDVLKTGVYQDELQKQGFEVVLPDRQTMEQILIPAIHALKRRDMEGAQNLLRIAIQILLVRAVNTVILASDELQALLPPDDPLLKRCLDPVDALARSTVKWARSVKAYKKNSINGG